MRRRSAVIGAMTSVLLVTISVRVFGQPSSGLTELRIASRQAAAAAAAGDLPQVKVHLQQTLNCLVGQRDDQYRSEAGDPCMGASALQKLPAGSANEIRVQKAIQLASVGVTFHDFKPAHYTAQAVQAVLDEGIKR